MVSLKSLKGVLGVSTGVSASCILALALLVSACSGDDGKKDTDVVIYCLDGGACPDGLVCLPDGTCGLAGDTVEETIEPDVVPDVEPDLTPDVKPEVKPDVVPDVEPDVEPELIPDVEPDQEPEVDAEEEIDVVPDVELDFEPELDAVEETDVCIPEEEICDGIDNDCDGLIDEDFGDNDGDEIDDCQDPDDDNDAYPDHIEIAVGTDPLDAEDFPYDMDGDEIPDTEDLDADGDGYPNDIEIDLGFDPLDWDSFPTDVDGDGIPDVEDDDIDGDGVPNDQDAFPYHIEEWEDTDGDGIGNNADLDDDGDGYSDELEAKYGTDPLDPTSFPADLDGDGIPDEEDDDIDGDGVLNEEDEFPTDPNEWVDTDGDGIGNNADTDDDDDGYSDDLELKYGSDPLDPLSVPGDIDGDFIPDAEDDDMDGDGYLNDEDDFPMDPNEWIDTDGDGIGDNADLDDDDDGYPDELEIKYGTDPLDPNSIPGDIDGDFIPDDEDPDMDGDGVLNEDDAFPKDPKEWIDTDGDGIGDNADTDDDNDGYSDELEIKYGTDPLDPLSYPDDMDGDFIPDAEDDDMDGDGVANDQDCEPTNPDIFPGQDEDCNLIDDNCDGDIDEGLCAIGEGCFKDGELNPDNPCESCDVLFSTEEWAVFDDETVCDDGSVCTVATVCIEGQCVGAEIDCDDGNACNGAESCDPILGCVDGAPLECDDGDFCNGVETCDINTGCVPGTPLDCGAYNCGLEECLTTCTESKHCAPDAFCDISDIDEDGDTTECMWQLGEGEYCQDGKDWQCMSGLCVESSCCAEGVCCDTFDQCSQEPLASACIDRFCVELEVPGAGDLMFTEFMVQPAVVGELGQWIEITNNTDKYFNLAGTTLMDWPDGKFFDVPADVPVALEPFDRVVFGASADKDLNGGAQVDVVYEDFPLDDEVHLSLWLGEDLLAELHYDTDFPQTEGASTALSSFMTDIDGSQYPWYWCEGTDQLGQDNLGTPGAENGDCGIAVTPPIDWCILKSPIDLGGVLPAQKIEVVGQFSEPYVTTLNPNGNDYYPWVEGEFGYGHQGDSADNWDWSPASYTDGFIPVGDEDEMTAFLQIEEWGEFNFGYRFRLYDPQSGTHSDYVYCDRNGVAQPDSGDFGTIVVHEAPIVDSVEYQILPIGSETLVWGERFFNVSDVTIGGVSQPFAVYSEQELVISPVDPGTPTGTQELVVYSDGLPSNAVEVEIVALTVDYKVLAHGAYMVVTSEGLNSGVDWTSVGWQDQAFSTTSPTVIKVGPIVDGTDLGEQPVHIGTNAGDIAPFYVTVIHLVINELDSDQESTDKTEFIELSTGVSDVNLDGYVLVLWNGSGDVAYKVVNLNAKTDENDLLLLGDTAVVPTPAISLGTSDTIQNGQDAAAVYQGKTTDYPVNSTVTNKGLIDALVYDTSDADDPDLLSVLLGSGPHVVQVDENGLGTGTTVSIQRCAQSRLDGRVFKLGAPNPGIAQPWNCL